MCPACAAAYEVPQDRVAAGRVVRCARCGADWTPLPVQPKPEPRPEPELEPAPTGLEPAPQSPPPSEAVPLPAPSGAGRGASGTWPSVSALSVAWALSAALLLAALWGAFAGRDAIMQAWPPSVRAYAALGLAGPR